METKYGRTESFTLQEWCQLNLGFYSDLAIPGQIEATLDELIENYYCAKGVVLDRQFVIDMLKSLPRSTAREESNGNWYFDLHDVVSYSQNLT